MIKYFFIVYLTLLPLLGQDTLSSQTVHFRVRDRINDNFKEIFATLVRAYENKDIITFLKHVHSDYRSLDTLNKRLDYNLLSRSLRDDFKILSNMRFQIFVNNIKAQKDGKRAKIQLRWNFRALISVNSQQILEKDRETTIIFEKQRDEWKMRSIQGICMFGRSNFQGKLIVEAPFILDGVPVNEDLEIDLFNGGNNGRVTLITIEDETNKIFNFQQVNLLNGVISFLGLFESVDSTKHLGLTSVFQNNFFLQGLSANGADVEEVFSIRDIGRVIRELRNNNGTVAPLPFGVRLEKYEFFTRGTVKEGRLTITFPAN